VRENNEGEYSEIGGRLFAGTENEMAIAGGRVYSAGCDGSCATPSSWRRRARAVTSATTSTASLNEPFWDEALRGGSRDYPDIKTTTYHSTS